MRRFPGLNADPSRREFLRLLGFGTIALGCGAGTKSGGEGSASTQGGQTYDYIVVGSGAGGGPLACNLALAGFKVLLIEAGSDQGNNVHYQVPAFHPKASQDPAMRWDYVVQHYSDPTRQQQDDKSITDSAGNPGVLYPRAAALGGCTAHHAMITVLPHDSDWDNIAKLLGDVDSSGNVLPTSDWAAVNMRQYFTAIENCTYQPQGTAGHGFGGWLQTELPSPTLGLTDGKLHQQLLSAAKAFASSVGDGLGTTLTELTDILNSDLNSADPARDTSEGLFGIPLATKNGARNGPRELIVQTAAQTSNLTVLTETLVTKVLFDDQRGSGGSLKATGVTYLAAAHLFQADPNSKGANADTRADLGSPPTGVDPTTVTPTQALASREVILCAGSFNTPQLLMLSGIGPGGALIDLPGVGKNLQDRYEVGVVSEVPDDFSIVSSCTYAGDSNDPCLQQWQNGSGPYTTNGAVCGIVLSSSRLLNSVAPTAVSPPDLFVFGVLGYFKGYYPRYDELSFADKHHFTWAVLKAHTGNTAGTVTLRSQNAWDTPVINFNYFDTGTPSAAQPDLDAVVAGVKFAQQINAAANNVEILPTFATYTEDLPGSANPDLPTWVQNEAWGHHACGTCRIGPDGDAMAVLDRNFNVRGTTGLRVVDASVFPSIPGFFIVVPVYMIGGKATAAILAAAAAHPVMTPPPGSPACVADGQTSQLDGNDCCSKNGIDGNGNCVPTGTDAGPVCVPQGQPSQQDGGDCCDQDGVDGGNCL